MGREVRKVHAEWNHPLNDAGDGHKPLYDGYKEDSKAFLELVNIKGLQEAVDYMGCPDKKDYMPDWDDEEKTHLMMYEDASKGTPISPAFKTPEELARWLEDNSASSFGRSTATYEQWLPICKGGRAPSMVLSSAGLQSGVEAMSAAATASIRESSD